MSTKMPYPLDMDGHLASEHGVKAPTDKALVHMGMHLYGTFREGHEHYHNHIEDKEVKAA